MEEHFRARQAMDKHTAHAHCMPDMYGYKYTHANTLCNTYCLSTAKMVKRTGLNITLYSHCLSCYFKVRTTIQTHLEEILHCSLTLQQNSYHGI